MIGEVVGNYRVTTKLAEGGMGTVYRAEHPLLGKTAAVKVLLPELSNNREIVNRFFTEARSATAVRHPGIVEIFDFGYMASGAAYIVMELLDGEPLSVVLVARGRLTEQEALIYTRGIASALAAAHAQGIVHRDLKPDNIFLVRDPDMVGGLRPKILDFGIAKVTEAQRVGGASSKTRTGMVMGTPTYMSPEQCRGVGEVDHRSDLYSVGCILYEMLVGRPPFASEGIGELLAMHQFMAPTPPSETGASVSAAAENLVLQLLQKRPEDRVQSAADLARLLGHGSMPPVASPGAPTVAVMMSTPPPLIPTPGPVRITGGAAAAVPVRITGGAAAAVPGHITGGAAAASAPTSAPSNAPTTLSSAAGSGASGAEIVASPRSSRGFLFAGIGVVLAAGAAIAIVLAGGGKPAPSQAAVPPASLPAAPPAAQPSPPPSAAPAGAPAAVTPPPAPAAEATAAAPMPAPEAAPPAAAPAPPVPVAEAPVAASSPPAASPPPATTTDAPTAPVRRNTTHRGSKQHVPSTKSPASAGKPVSPASIDRGD